MFRLFLTLIFIVNQGKIHIVQKGETLWEIAEKYYYDPLLWPFIWNANLELIEDPNLIYPEDIIVIPPFEEEISPPETLKPKIKLKERKIEIKPESVYVYPEKIIVVKYKRPVVSYTFAYRAGFLGNIKKIKNKGAILRTVERRKREILIGDEVIVSLGSDNGVKKGDLLTVIRRGRKLNPKRKGVKKQRLIKVLGTLRVLEVYDKTSRAVVVECFDIIRRKDYVIPYRMPEMIYDAEFEPVEGGVIGKVISKEEKRLSLLPYSFVYINLGKNDGVDVGDILEVYKEGRKIKDPASKKKIKLPDKLIGIIQVLQSFDYISVAYVKSITHDAEIEVGDKVKMVLNAYSQKREGGVEEIEMKGGGESGNKEE